MREIVEKVQKEDGALPARRVQVIYKPLPTNDPQKRRADTTRAKQVLDWQPQAAAYLSVFDRLTGRDRQEVPRSSSVPAYVDVDDDDELHRFVLARGPLPVSRDQAVGA